MDKIKSLIEQGKIKEALNSALEVNENCILLKASHNNLEKSFNVGLITLNDFKREEANITNKLLDIL